MLLKTNLANQQALLDCLKSHHPYQTPELLVLPVVMAITIISHGSTLPYADPAAVQHQFAGLFDAPGRSNFIPADQAFVFDFSKTSTTSTSPGR
jgi:hypothetical protein